MASESLGASTYEWHSVIQGHHHVCKEVWTPTLGEELFLSLRFFQR